MRDNQIPTFVSTSLSACLHLSVSIYMALSTCRYLSFLPADIRLGTTAVPQKGATYVCVGISQHEEGGGTHTPAAAPAIESYLARVFLK